MTISIYLIDDDHKFSKLLMEELDSEPAFEVLGNALTLESARRFIRTQDVDVFLVDIALPDGSGFDLMRELSQTRPASKVLALSTLGDKKHILGSIEAGATGFLLKSEPPENFIRSIIAMVTHGGYLGPHASHILIGHIRKNAKANYSKVINTSSNEPVASIKNPEPDTVVRTGYPSAVAEIAPITSANKPEMTKIPVESVSALGENIVKDDFTPREIQVIHILQLGQPAKLMASKLGVSTFTINQHLRSIYRKLNARNKMEAVLNARNMGLL
ncbi:MAG: response regulator transcription factor [Rhodoferax sp.]|nr:response regulator transcription factor [Rhodoferax sp.]